ncbi:MAG TPA: carbohydrate binding family 9 domain-containing protein, partial [Gemmatimonadaceae bacterium]
MFESIPSIDCRPLSAICAWLVVCIAAAPPAAIQAQQSAPPTTTDSNSSRTAVATRAEHAPVIDGKDDDAVWRAAPAVSSFREHDPVEDSDPRFRTEFKIAYDSHNIYVFVRAFDNDPKAIRTTLARRDARAPTDQIIVMIDSYHDGRSGFEFCVSPGGVKRDFAIYNDNNEDGSWDGVWDVATRIDSLGWTAEYAIPMSQLGFT